MNSSLTSDTNSIDAKALGFPNVAFVAKAGSGKSTAAQLLVNLGGYKLLSFASPLKDIAVQLWGAEAYRNRTKLQQLGTLVRDIDVDTWLNLFVNRFHLETRPVVNDDCRFENEWATLKGLGFTIVEIVTPKTLRIDRLKANGKLQDEAQLDHSSETAVDHLLADYLIPNDGSRLELEERVIEVVRQEMKRR